MNSQDFPDFWIVCFTNLSLPQNFLERREVATKEKKEVTCIVSKPLVSCLWGCGEVCISTGICPVDHRETHGPLPIFQDFLLVSNLLKHRGLYVFTQIFLPRPLLGEENSLV